MDEDGISFEGKGEPKELSPRRSSKQGRSHRPPDSSGNSSHAHDNERAGNTPSLMAPVPAATTLDEDKKARACHGFKFGDNNKVSDALLARLSKLGASAPWFVDSKRLQSTDARVNQNRLELSGRGPISSRAFTDAEKDLARTTDGIPVTAFDASGREYGMTCKLWKNDKHYRFIGQGWKLFREAHRLTIAKDDHLTRRVTVELWAFRSRALRRKGEGGEEEPRGGHPDGAIGLVVLLCEDGGGGVKEEVNVGVEEAAVAPEESRYLRWFLELMAAVGLLKLRTMGRTKRKRDAD
ncbi:hypothetical protein HU200_037280 [Digitaria exilis]|uniref:TF-B3 domain-containing protein n=1 Tax=Digitaria exilis TaxID=1010633 RepID=A0A835BNR4_9POAL|nr:hypothetical protein HU200_037280 [Digitaria exilis]